MGGSDVAIFIIHVLEKYLQNKFVCFLNKFEWINLSQIPNNWYN